MEEDRLIRGDVIFAGYVSSSATQVLLSKWENGWQQARSWTLWRQIDFSMTNRGAG